MGSIIDAHCKCGYERKGMCLDGGSPMPKATVDFSFYCPKCKDFFEATLQESGSDAQSA